MEQSYRWPFPVMCGGGVCGGGGDVRGSFWSSACVCCRWVRMECVLYPCVSIGSPFRFVVHEGF